MNDCQGRVVLPDATIESAAGEVTQALLAVPGVTAVQVVGQVVTIGRDPAGPGWPALAEPVRYALMTALSTEHPSGASPRADASLDDDGLFEAAQRVLQVKINPGVAQHGGKVEIIDVQDGTVLLRMSGGCQGCGMASVTLRQGIEASLRRALPGLRGVRDITDHAAGTKPYFAPRPG